MNRIASIYALLGAADPVGDRDALDCRPIAARLESALGWDAAGMRPAPTALKEAAMTTQPAAQPGVLTRPPSSRTWRGPLIALGTAAAVVTLVAAAAFGWWLGSEETAAPVASVSPEVLQTIDDWGAAYLTEPFDYAVFERLYGDSGILNDPHGTWVGGSMIVGHLELGDPYVEFTRFDRSSVIAGPGVVVVEWDARGNSTPVLGSALEPFETTIVSVFEIPEDTPGHIRESTTYFDQNELYNRD